MKNLRRSLTPQWWMQRGPYHRKDWCSRLRRLAEGWMPLGLHMQVRRIELAIRYRKRLSAVPKVGLPLHVAWFTQAEMDWSEQIARDLSGEQGGGDRG